MPILIGFSFTLLTAVVVIFGDYIIKIAADEGQSFVSPLVIAGCVLYAVSALMWFLALQHVSLSQAGVAFSMLTLLALCIIGVMCFGEKLYLREYAGIGCAMLAMILMVRVA